MQPQPQTDPSLLSSSLIRTSGWPGTEVQEARVETAPTSLQCAACSVFLLLLVIQQRQSEIACMLVICTRLATYNLAGLHAYGFLLLILTANGKPAGWSYYCAYRSLWKMFGDGVRGYGKGTQARAKVKKLRHACSYTHRTCPCRTAFAATQESHQASESASCAGWKVFGCQQPVCLFVCRSWW